MAELFKKFGMGILYILVLPIFLLALIIFGAYGVIVFILLSIKSIFLFFMGKSLHGELEEDIKARKILHPEPEKKEEPEPIIIIDTPKEEIIKEAEPSPKIEIPAPVIEEKKIEEPPVEPIKIEQQPVEEIQEVVKEEPKPIFDNLDIFPDFDKKETKSNEKIEEINIEDMDFDDDDEILPLEDNRSRIKSIKEEKKNDNHSGVSFSNWEDDE